MVWKLDRFSRSLRGVLTIMERLMEAKVGFRSLTEATDTTSKPIKLEFYAVCGK
jgi:DNA invertase Pin-like site-specific DNA recombinase